MPRLLVLALSVVAFGLSGCSGSGSVAGTAQEAYDRGVEAFDAGKHIRAIEHFRTALDFGRTSELADDAQLYLARSYAGSRQYLLAGNEFTRFIEFYRTDPRVEQAAYERIQAYAELSPRYELDQTDTNQAIAYIQAYLRQYPQSPNVEAASALMAEMREKLALKLFEGGRLYERRELFEAAVMTFREVLASYPTSEVADDALVAAVRAQVLFAQNSVPDRQAERYQEALRLYDQLVTLFPSSPLLREAEGLYDRAYQGRRAAGGMEAAEATASDS
jgi:outer membrane protein assembly factor BamD